MGSHRDAGSLWARFWRYRRYRRYLAALVADERTSGPLTPGQYELLKAMAWAAVKQTDDEDKG